VLLRFDRRVPGNSIYVQRSSHLLVVNRRPARARRAVIEVRAVRLADALSGEKLELDEGRTVIDLEAGGWRLLEFDIPLVK
jgi:hypothetical protein